MIFFGMADKRFRLPWLCTKKKIKRKWGNSKNQIRRACFYTAVCTWSRGMFTSLMSPNGMKAACTIASSTFSSRPPAA